MSPVSSPKYSSGSTLLSPYGPFDQSLGYSRAEVLSSSRYGASHPRYLSSSPCQDRVHNYHQMRGRPDPHTDLRVRRGDVPSRAHVRGPGLRPNVRGRSTTRAAPSPTSPLSVRRRSVSYSDLTQELVLLDIQDQPSRPSRQHRVGREGAERNCRVLLRNIEVSGCMRLTKEFQGNALRMLQVLLQCI